MELPQDAELELIREKEGVAVCRVRLPEQTCILKYFSRDEDCREITVYQLLGFAGLPSIPLLMYTKRSLLMEDLGAEGRFRLAEETDLRDPEQIRFLARWYRALHRAGREAGALPGFGRETDALTPEGLELLRKRLGPYPGQELMETELHRIQKRIGALEETLVYNDFALENLAASRKGKALFPFDYNRMGWGYSYGDLRNVTVSLPEPMGRLFLEAYGPVNPEEILVDRAIAPLTALIQACGQAQFPRWAEESRRELMDGRVRDAWQRLTEAEEMG